MPNKSGPGTLLDPETTKPLLTLAVSAVFGIFGAATAVFSFASARANAIGLFQGASLVAAIIAAGFGCWLYVWIARPRFAAQLTGNGDVFGKLLRFYATAALSLMVLGFVSAYASNTHRLIEISLWCMTGGAGAAAAFQTVLAFVPHYDESGSNT